MEETKAGEDMQVGEEKRFLVFPWDPPLCREQLPRAGARQFKQNPWASS